MCGAHVCGARWSPLGRVRGLGVWAIVFDSMTGRRWKPGDGAVLRYITRTEGRPGDAWPCRVVEDGEHVALYIPGGTSFKRTVFPPQEQRRFGGALTHRDASWGADTLRLMYPGRSCSVWLFWKSGPQGRRFDGWYVNMEEPFRRTAIGFDTNDHTLDIVVTPELGWSWKDEEELEHRVARGIYTPDLAASARAEGERVIQQIERREPPFSGGWKHWEPDPGWPRPELPDDWNRVPPALWARRRWAYGTP